MRRSVTVGWSVFSAALLIALPAFWYSRLASAGDVRFVCATPSTAMAQAIDARVRDPRLRVDHVRVVEGHDARYENLFLASAEVRAGGVSVGIGTWAANVSDLGSFRGWSRVPTYYSLEPVNDLARTISSGRGDLRSPGMTRAAKASQTCGRFA